MILEEIVRLDCEPQAIVAFLEDMDRHYLHWHHDHVAFRWTGAPGARKDHFFFEEIIGRFTLRATMYVTRSADGRSATAVPTSRFLRLVFPELKFTVTADASGCVFFHRVRLRLGPLRPFLEASLLAPLRRHMAEESAGLRRIVAS